MSQVLSNAGARSRLAGAKHLMGEEAGCDAHGRKFDAELLTGALRGLVAARVEINPVIVFKIF